MNNINRKRAMIVCLMLLIPMLLMSIVNYWFPDALSVILGVAAGWALRETLSPIPEGE